MQRIVYSSSDLIGDEALRKDQWISSLSSGYAHLRADPAADTPFTGELRIARTGDVSVGTIRGTVKSISRTTDDIAAQNTNNVVFLSNSSCSPLYIEQSGRSVELAPLASVLIEQSEPSIIRVADGKCGLIAVQTERELVRQRYGSFEDHLMTVLPAPSVVGGLIRAYVDALVNPQEPMPPLVRWFAADHIADLIAAAVSVEPLVHSDDGAGFGALSRRRFASARAYIYQNLANPLLSQEHVAAHVRISKSQLRKDFACSGLSVGQYIREQRLAKALVMLKNPLLQHHRIIDIAYACGFQNLATFNRLIRNAYRMTPSEIKQGAHS